MVELIEQFGFPIVAMVGLGYFVYYVWRTIINIINPAIKEMHFTLIKLIDQIRMLDQDMIRMQQKVNTVLQMKEMKRRKNKSNSLYRMPPNDKKWQKLSDDWVKATIESRDEKEKRKRKRHDS